MMLSKVKSLRLFALLFFSLLITDVYAKQSESYLVQPGDILQISVWKEADLQLEAAVRPDGILTFPLVGEVIVGDRSVEDITKTLEKGLHRYIADAVVTVAVSQTLGNKVFVIGQVNRPGEFVINRPVDILQALTMAGGMTPFAKRDRILVLRRGSDGKQEPIEFKYSNIEKGEKLEQNIILKSGDTVLIP